MMEAWARTNEKSYLNNYKGEEWQRVKEVFCRYPSGYRKCYQFPDGFICKADRCEACYVF